MMELAPTRALKVTVLVGMLLSPACGGGGGGGGAIPTAPAPAPPPPSGPAPTTEEAGDETLFGRVEGMFDPAASFTEARIRVVGAAEDTIRTDNSFFLDPVPPGDYVLSVTGPTLLNRKVEIEMKAGGANEIARLDLVEVAPFNIEAFDEIYRSEGERGTARFTERPDFYIDQKSFNKLAGGNGARLAAEIEEAIQGPMRRAISPFLNRVQIITRSLQQYASPCDLPEGDINWYADHNLRDENGQPLLGLAWWCWWESLNRVRGGMLFLDDSAGTGTILHELVHILGSADHLQKTPGSSIIQSPRFLDQLSEMDEMHLAFLYIRPPGLMTPDDARGLGAAGLTSLSGGSGMEVRCLIYPDGRVVLERGWSGAFAR